MTGNRRTTTERLQALSTNASVLTLLVAASGMMATTVTRTLAACDATAPGSGQTVTCDATAPNPETNAVIAPGSTAVIVTVEPGAALQTATSPAISLGGDSYVDLAPGSSIADLDPATLPADMTNVIEGDFTGVATRQDLADLYGGISAGAPAQPTPASATIDFGQSGDQARQTAIHETTAKVTVNKAKMADKAMNAITQFIISSVIVPPPPSDPSGPRGNVVIVEGGTVISGGAAGIRSDGDSLLQAVIFDGGSVATVTADAPAILLDGDNSALQLQIENGAVSTFFDGAAGISASGGSSAVDILL
jgi:hypothetical protein